MIPLSERGRAGGFWVQNMKRLRRNLGLSQRVFAERAGVSKDAVSSWDIGRVGMSYPTALRISARLRVNLVGGDLRPWNPDAYLAARAAAFERRLRRRLGL